MTSGTDTGNYNRLAKWVILLVVAVYILPLVLLGHNSYIRLHDTLEGEWIWLKVLVDSHMAYNLHYNAIVPQIMKGIPRSMYPPAFSVNMLLVQCLGAYEAYIVSGLLIRIVGFFGMVLLLRDYFIKGDENRFIVWLCALGFSGLSTFVPFGLAVLGQPLLLWAFLNLHNQTQRPVSFLIIAAFPYYASIVWLAIPFLTLLGTMGAYFIYKSTLNRHYVAGVLLLMVTFALSNFQMLDATFAVAGFVPHRLAYNLYMFEKPTIGQSLGESFLMFFITHYHIAIFITAVSFTAILLTVRKSEPLILGILAAIILICLFQGFYTFPEYWLSDKFSFMKSFRFNRFTVLLPFLWFMGFALAVAKMRSSAALKSFVLPFLLMQIFLAVGGNDEVVHNYRTLAGHQKFPNFENYYAVQQFNEIKKYIGQPVDSYCVASLGISPSVAQYNGFYTLDGLMSIYDLHYKQKFRDVFAGEIAKSNDIRQYYDGWGNRCYIFSSELGIKHEAFNCYKFSPRHVDHFDFNAKAFTALGGKYLISAVEIENCDAEGLHFEKVFKDPVSWWTIYLYSVKPNV